MYKVFLISNAQTIIYINIWILTQLIPSVCKIYFDIGHRLKYKSTFVYLGSNLIRLGKKNKVAIKNKQNKKKWLYKYQLFFNKMMLKKCKTKLGENT